MVQNEPNWSCLHSVIERIAADTEAARHKVCSHNSNSTSHDTGILLTYEASSFLLEVMYNLQLPLQGHTQPLFLLLVYKQVVFISGKGAS